MFNLITLEKFQNSHFTSLNIYQQNYRKKIVSFLSEGFLNRLLYLKTTLVNNEIANHAKQKMKNFKTYIKSPELNF